MGLGSGGRRIVIEFIGDSKGLSSAAGQGEKALTGFSGTAQKVGSIAGKALAGGLLLAGAAAVKATQAAAEDQAAQAQLAQQLRQAAGASDAQIASTEEWITAQGKALGVSDDELRPALAKLATATGDVGEAQKLAALAMDVAAGSGQSLESVTKTLAKAQTTGSAAAFAKLGGATKDAAGNTLSLADATQSLADKYNGAASKAAETTAGKQKILTVQMGELQEQIGAKLLPVMVKLADIGLKVVDWVSQNTTTVGVLVGALGGLLAVTYAVGLATKIAGSFTTIWSAITKAAAAAQWLLNVALDANPIGLVIIAIAALVAGLIIAYKHSETFRNIVDAAFDACRTVVLGALDAIRDAVGAVIGFIRNHWALLLGILTGPIGLAVVEIIKHWDKIKSATSNMWDAVTGIIRDGADKVVDFVRGIPGRLSDLAQKFAGAGRDLIGAFVNGLKGTGGFVSDIAGNVWDGLRGMLNAAIDKINAALSFSFNTHIPGVGTVTVNPPDIPHLARGGIVTRPTVALLGEAGPEAVIPLSRGAGVQTAPIVLQVLLDGRVIEQALIKRTRDTGRPLAIRVASA